MNNFSYILKLETLPANLQDMVTEAQAACTKDGEFYLYLDDEDENASFPSFKCFYLYYCENVFAGFLSIFIQDVSSACISGFVLPEYRRKHIFTALFQNACEELSKLPTPIHDIEFHIPLHDATATTPAIQFLKQNGYSLHHEEYLLCYDFDNSDLKTNSNSGLISDSKISLEPDSNFDCEFDEENSEYTFWLGDTYIGGCLIYTPEPYAAPDCEPAYVTTPEHEPAYATTPEHEPAYVTAPEHEPVYATIYDYEILEEYRGNGYGKNGLLAILKDLQEQKIQKVLLHVSGLNKKAHSLYISCGFQVQSGFSVHKPSDV